MKSESITAALWLQLLFSSSGIISCSQFCKRRGMVPLPPSVLFFNPLTVWTVLFWWSLDLLHQYYALDRPISKFVGRLQHLSISNKLLTNCQQTPVAVVGDKFQVHKLYFYWLTYIVHYSSIVAFDSGGFRVTYYMINYSRISYSRTGESESTGLYSSFPSFQPCMHILHIKVQYIRDQNAFICIEANVTNRNH